MTNQTGKTVETLARECECGAVVMRAFLIGAVDPNACPACGHTGRLTDYAPQFVRREVIKRPRLPTS